MLLADFADSADVYLMSDTYHNETVSLPQHETVPYWQGSGTNYDFNDISSIDVKIKDGTNNTTKEIKQSGILGVMFDTNALGVANLNQRTTTAYNARTKEIKQSGILGVMFDTNALGVANLNQRTTTAYNARAEFYTNFYKMDAGYFNDLNENFVVFYIADTANNASVAKTAPTAATAPTASK